jgi:hypothetical protein
VTLTVVVLRYIKFAEIHPNALSPNHKISLTGVHLNDKN